MDIEINEIRWYMGLMTHRDDVRVEGDKATVAIESGWPDAPGFFEAGLHKRYDGRTYGWFMYRLEPTFRAPVYVDRVDFLVKDWLDLTDKMRAFYKYVVKAYVRKP